MAVYYWVGGWTGNTGFNAGFAATGNVSVIAGPTGDIFTYGPLWTSPFNGAQSPNGDFAFGPYYWGFSQNWRLRVNIPNSNNYRLSATSVLPRGGDTVLFGTRSITTTNLTEASLLFGGITGSTSYSWLGSTGLTTSISQGVIHFSVENVWGHPSTDNSLQVTNGPAGFGEYKNGFRVNQIGFDCGEGGTSSFSGNVLGLSADQYGVELLKILSGNFQSFSPYAKIGILNLKANTPLFVQHPVGFTGPENDPFNDPLLGEQRPPLPYATPPASSKLSGPWGGVSVLGGNFTTYDQFGQHFTCNSVWVAGNGGAIGDLLLNEEYSSSTMVGAGNVTIIPYRVNGVIGIYASVPGTLSIYRPSTPGTMNVELGSKHGFGGITIAQLNTFDQGVSSGLSLGEIKVDEFSFTVTEADLQAGVFQPSEYVQPIGIYPIFQSGKVSQSATINLNHPTLDSSEWNNTIVGFSPSDKGLTIVEGGRKIIFSPGTNFKTTDGLTQA